MSEERRTYGTRTLLELRIGGGSGSRSPATVEVLVHLRRADLEWWNGDVSDHESQLFKIIGRRVLPAECRDEIEGRDDRRKRRRGGDDRPWSRVVIGEKNLRSAAAASGGVSDGQRQGEGKGAKRSASEKGGNRAAAGKKDKKNVERDGKKEGKHQKNALRGDFSYLFGDTIQITYKVEDLPVSNTATLLYNAVPGDESEDDERGENEKSGNTAEDAKGRTVGRKDKAKASAIATFRHVQKIPKRIIVWCYHFNPKNPTEPNPDDGGFQRPELIPISSLFS